MITVAYIDSDTHTALRVCLLCRRQGGIRMHAFPSVRDALEDHRSNPVDLIVADNGSSGQDGPELLAALRSRGDRTPVILLTPEDEPGRGVSPSGRDPAVRIIGKGMALEGPGPQLVRLIRMARRMSVTGGDTAE